MLTYLAVMRPITAIMKARRPNPSSTKEMYLPIVFMSELL